MILTRDIFVGISKADKIPTKRPTAIFLKGSTTLLPPLMSANILRLTCNDSVRPNYFFLQFLRARISSSCFLQSETVFLAMVWGHAMHSLELAAAAPRLEQQSVCWVYSCLFSWPEALPGLGKRH